MSRLHDRAQRWRRIVAAQARGESISPQDQAYRAAYELSRPAETERETPLWSAVGSFADTPLPEETPDDDIVAGALAGLDGVDLATLPSDPIERAPKAPRRRIPLVAGALAATVTATAAAAALWLVGARALRPDTDGGSAHTLSSALAKTEDGSEARTRVDPPKRERRHDAARTVAPPVAPQPGCEELGPGLRACLRGEGEIMAGRPTTIELRHGRVQVWADDGSEVVPVTVTTEVAALASEVASFEATLSEDPPVLVLLVHRGRVTVLEDGMATAEVRPGDPVVIGGGDSETVREPVADEPSPPASRRPSRNRSPDALLGQARALFAAGNSRAAVAAYRQLIDRHPVSVEARVALVSLGRIELQRGRAARALGYFDRYLSESAGPLRQEARYGRIRALRALGRTDQERRSIEAFLADHSESIYGPRLRRRLGELGDAG